MDFVVDKKFKQKKYNNFWRIFTYFDVFLAVLHNYNWLRQTIHIVIKNFRYGIFVGSQATNFGQDLYKRHEELWYLNCHDMTKTIYRSGLVTEAVSLVMSNTCRDYCVILWQWPWQWRKAFKTMTSCEIYIWVPWQANQFHGLIKTCHGPSNFWQVLVLKFLGLCLFN